MNLSLNKLSVELAKHLVDYADELRITYTKINEATVIDTGIKTTGSFEAGLLVSKITMGGVADVSMTSFQLDDLFLPSVLVRTDYPVEACILSQLAGWRVQVKDFFANGSGPARILARKPKRYFETFGYSETANETVLVLETDKYPNDEVVDYVARETGVGKGSIYLVLVSPASIVGSVQVSARIVETGLYKLDTLGFNLRSIRNGVGISPIAPLHSDPLVMAGKTNDMLLYGGSTYYIVDLDNDDYLREIVGKAPSSSSKDYGRSFTEMVKEYGWDFLYKVDPSIFAPAVMTINNVRTGRVFRAGRINKDVLRRALGLTS
ncbi:MAG: methenyltetrahydromethanopterin cyclohydrolase [Vulcanisaeta sp.]